MRHLGPAFGPDITFLGVPRLDFGDPSQEAGVVILGAPFDGGTSYRAGARFGPSALRQACYMPHNGARRSLALGVDPLTELKVHDAGDLPCYAGEIEQSIQLIERSVRMTASSGAIPVILGGDHTIALADMRGIAAHHGFGRIGMLHFDAHPDTGGEERGGPLYGHGKPMRQLIESGAVRGDRFIQFGLRGYWPGPETLRWMAERGMRSYEMSEIGARGLDSCLSEAFDLAMDDCDGVFLSVDIDVVDPGHAPGTGTPEPGGLTARELLDAVRRAAYELPVVGLEVVEVAPPYDHADITAILGSRVVLEALSGIARRRLDAAEGRWDPTVPLLERDLSR